MSAVNLNSVRAAVEILHWAKLRKAEIKELEENARATVESALGDAELGTVDGVPAIKWGSYKRTALDQKALKQARPEIVAEFQKTTEVRRFEILDGPAS
jgi:predicted phage-related endonuclease